MNHYQSLAKCEYIQKHMYCLFFNIIFRVMLLNLIREKTMFHLKNTFRSFSRQMSYGKGSEKLVWIGSPLVSHKWLFSSVIHVFELTPQIEPHNITQLQACLFRYDERNKFAHIVLNIMINRGSITWNCAPFRRECIHQ